MRIPRERVKKKVLLIEIFFLLEEQFVQRWDALRDSGR
jgi:hypothetical protein